jgi:hypothetical protein
MSEKGEPKPVRPWDLFNKNKERTTEELKEKRLAICRECEFFVSFTQQCLKCGCLMPLKTKLADAYCPIQKWEAETEPEVPFRE